MNMTLSKGTVINMAPQAQQLAEGESIRVTVPSSTSPGGATLVNIQRMTADYFYVSELK